LHGTPDPDRVEQGWLTRVDGARMPYVMRALDADELDAAFALHREVLQGLPAPHLFRADSRDFMARHIDERGRTIGTFADGRLVGYAVISFPDDEPDNLGRDVPLPAEEMPHVADYDGSAVHPDFRGNGLQLRMSELRHRIALARGRHHILGTVSPDNPASLGNFLRFGFQVRNLRNKYGGALRLIIHRDLRRPQLEVPGTVAEVPLTDTEVIGALLRQGHIGTRVVAGDPPRLAMAAEPNTSLEAIGA
jgi:ribosomal protein S18 acetylase RimI-like enzyme